MNLLNQYPSIMNRVAARVKENGIEILKNGHVVFNGNADLLKLLHEIDGSKSVHTLISSLTDSEENYNKALPLVEKIITELANQKIIYLNDSAHCSPSINLADKIPIIPKIVSLELTNKCNLACSYCYQKSSIKRNEYLNSPIEILEYLKTIGVEAIELTGGEPLLHPKFQQIANFVMHHFEYFSLITNGTLLNNKILDLFSQGKGGIQICLDGSTRQAVESITGISGSFQKIITAIRLVRQYNILLRVGMVVEKSEQIEDIENTLLLAQKLGAISFIINPSIDIGRSNEKFIHDNTTLSKLRDVHLEMMRKYPGFYYVETYSLEAFEEILNCGVGAKRIAVNWTGNIKLCPIQDVTWLNLGKINNIENDNVQKKLLSFDLMESPNMKICGDCKHLFYCMKCIIRPLNLLRKGYFAPEACTWYLKNKLYLDEAGYSAESYYV